MNNQYIHFRILGERLRTLRNEKQMSQEELSKVTGIDRPYISEIENGIKNPSYEVLIRLAQGLGITFRELTDFDLPRIDLPDK